MQEEIREVMNKVKNYRIQLEKFKYIGLLDLSDKASINIISVTIEGEVIREEDEIIKPVETSPKKQKSMELTLSIPKEDGREGGLLSTIKKDGEKSESSGQALSLPSKNDKNQPASVVGNYVPDDSEYNPLFIDEKAEEMAQLKDQVDAIELTCDAINRREQLLDLQRTHFTAITLLQNDCRPFDILWSIAANYN